MMPTSQIQDAMVQELRGAYLLHRSSSSSSSSSSTAPPHVSSSNNATKRTLSFTSHTGRSSSSSSSSSSSAAPPGDDSRVMAPPAQQQQAHLSAEGLILPKKPFNPCVESREVQDLNKEIRWNARVGVNVLGGKSELAKEMDRRKWNRQNTEKSKEDKTDFHKVLEERAKRIEDLEKPRNDDVGGGSGDSGHCSPEPESEFLKVHAQLKGRSCS